MSKKAGDHAVAGLQRLSAGAVGAAVTVATANPLAGMAAAAVALTATDYVKSKLTDDGPDLTVPETEAILSLCMQLDERVAAIEAQLDVTDQRIDRQDLLTKESTFSKFARSVSEAATVEKREAIVHATAYQFDPRKGLPEARDYWLRRVRAIPDAELALVRLLVEYGEITFFDNVAYATTDANNAQSPATTPLAIGRADVVVLETVAQQAAATGPGQLVYMPAHRKVVPPAVATSTTALGTASGAPAYALTSVGGEFVKFISAD